MRCHQAWAHQLSRRELRRGRELLRAQRH